MTIRVMRPEDLRMVLGWAAEEGWNPGFDDAAAFHAADPDGFFLKEVNGAPVAAVSVVNHDADFAFLGLYLCKSEFRGQGHGLEVWRAGIAHAGRRCIGLDGVPDQQDNYARSGFSKVGSTVRFEGRVDARADPRLRKAKPSDLPWLINQDLNAAGIRRTRFATVWLSHSQDRQTVVLTDGDEIAGFATFRRCQLGTKVGPLHADSEADAQALLAANPFAVSGEPLFVDTQGHASPLARLLKAQGFGPVFETARMFTGAAPKTAPPLYYAIATMELG